MTNGKKFNPHMLRHWYATDMIRRGISPEVVRRQMRHANVNVTLQIYTQVKDEEIVLALPNRPSGTRQKDSGAKIINMRKLI